LDKSFRDFFDFMFGLKIPVVYGVIPDKLQKDAAIFLRRAKKDQPKLLDIVQHGFAHSNYADEGEDKYEFGPARTYEQQRDDIVKGQSIMDHWFGELATPGFIPPFHADDENTINALEDLKVPLYSARLKVPRLVKRFIDLPAQIWANKIDAKGLPKPLNFRSLSIDLASVLESGPVTGMVFHHDMMVAPKDKEVLMALMKLVLQQRAERKIRTILFSDLLNAREDKKNDR